MAETNGNTKLKVASLFCGCGGMDLGIQGDFNFLNKHFSALPFELSIIKPPIIISSRMKYAWWKLKIRSSSQTLLK